MTKARQFTQSPNRLIQVSAVFAALLLGVHGISLWAGVGQVVDAETGKPLTGVFAIAMWHANGNTSVSSRTVCHSFAVTQSDSNGQYVLPTFSWNFSPFLSNRQRYKEFYLAGYEISPSDDLAGATIKMRRYKGSAAQRLNDLSRGIAFDRCVSPGDKKAKLAALYKAQYEEAKAIATTPEEKKMAEAIRASSIEAEFGFGSYVQKLAEENK